MCSSDLVMGSADIESLYPGIGSRVLIRAESPGASKLRAVGLGASKIAAGEIKLHLVPGVHQGFSECAGESTATYDAKSEFQGMFQPLQTRQDERTVQQHSTEFESRA